MSVAYERTQRGHGWRRSDSVKFSNSFRVSLGQPNSSQYSALRGSKLET